MSPRTSIVLGLLLLFAPAAVAQPAPRTPARIDDGTIAGKDVGALARFGASPGLTASDDSGRLVVSAVDAGGPWHALGLRGGDVVVAVNGHLAATRTAMEDGLMTIGRAEVLYVEVERDKKPLLLRRVVVGAVHAPADDPAVEAALAAMVTHRGGTVWEVDVDAALANPMQIAKGARVVPSIKDGKPDGIKLYAIRPSSFYARVGLKNGDTVVRVNGQALTSMDRSLEIYTSVRDADKVVVEIIRRGKPVTHTYLRKNAAKARPRKP